METPITFALGEGCIKTLTGRVVDLLNPTEDMFNYQDISISLSRKCRYNGHTSTFYSVAAHSLAVAYALPTELQFHGLLHDAAEAYLPDIARPIKPYIVGFDKIEGGVMGAIYEYVGMDYLGGKFEGWEEIKKADNGALMVEADLFMGERFIERGWTNGSNTGSLILATDRLSRSPIESVAKEFEATFLMLLSRQKDRKVLQS